MLVNNNFTHIETAGSTGYTGVYPWDRDTYAVYPANQTTGDEVLAQALGSPTGKVGQRVYQTRGWLAAPYHAITAIGRWIEMGASVQIATDAGVSGTTIVSNIDFAYPQSNTYQTVGSTDVVTYPCQGTTGTAYSMGSEIPSPVPNRNIRTNPVGQAVYVMVAQGNILSLTNATMINVATGAPVTLLPPVTGSNDVNQGYYGYNFGYVLPSAPLLPNTQYAVTISGLNGTVPFSRSFTFTTGNVTPY